jgi:hypothetical protein
MVQESILDPNAGEAQQVRLLGGRILRLIYYSYPADSPEQTKQDFIRVSSDPTNAQGCGPQP